LFRALESQTYPKNLYDVIVVDNASDEDIESVVSQFGQALDYHTKVVRLICGSPQGDFFG